MDYVMTRVDVQRRTDFAKVMTEAGTWKLESTFTFDREGLVVKVPLTNVRPKISEMTHAVLYLPRYMLNHIYMNVKVNTAWKCRGYLTIMGENKHLIPYEKPIVTLADDSYHFATAEGPRFNVIITAQQLLEWRMQADDERWVVSDGT